MSATLSWEGGQIKLTMQFADHTEHISKVLAMGSIENINYWASMKDDMSMQ